MHQFLLSQLLNCMTQSKIIWSQHFTAVNLTLPGYNIWFNWCVAFQMVYVLYCAMSPSNGEAEEHTRQTAMNPFMTFYAFSH